VARHSKVLAAIASLLAFLALAPLASAAPKTILAEVGTVSGGNGAAGGLFNTPRGVALNRTGAGGVPKGTFYVLEQGNARIQQFKPGGEFARAWGAGVLSGNSDVFEVCTVAANCKAGAVSSIAGGYNFGSATASTSGIAVDQSTGTLYVSDPGNRRIDVFSASGTFRGAFGWAVRLNGEAAALQFCTTATECKAGSNGANAGQFAAVMGGIAVAPVGAPNAGDVFIASGTNRRVDQFKPTLEGGAVTGVSFVRGFGWDVANTGDPGNTGTVQFEVCSTACKVAGTAGAQAGNFATTSPTDVAVDSEGNVFALDKGNKRVQEFSPVPAPIEPAFGSGAIGTTFGTDANLLQNIAIDSSTTPNHLMVSGKRSAAGGKVAVLELDHSGVLVDVHGPELSATESTGLAVAPASLAGYIYLATPSPNRIVVLGDSTATPTIEAADPPTATTAMLHGQIVSNNAETSYRFEYSADEGKTWFKLPASDVTVPPSPGSVPVSQEATGLLPNTKYLFRLVSLRPVGGFSFISDTEAFTTLAAPPAAPDVSAVGIGNTSARLVGQVNPNSAATTYVFEYGTTPSFSSSTAMGSAGSGSSAAVVSQTIAGLSPGTTYFFHLVATNSAGSTPSPTRTFTTRMQPLPPPPIRGYEMVSPPDKNFGAVDGFGGAKAIGSWDGESAAFCTSAQFGEDPPLSTLPCIDYVSERSDEGWKTSSVYGSFCTHDPNDPVAATAKAEVKGYSPDLDLSAFWRPDLPGCGIQPLDISAPLGTNLYRKDFSANPATYDLLTPKPLASPTLVGENGVYAAASDDFSHIVYSSTGLQTKEATGTFHKLFEWDHGTLRLVSKDASDESFTTSSWIPYSSEVGSSDGVNSVSANGNRIFFQNPVNSFTKNCEVSCNVYLRESGTTTHEVSASERTPLDPGGVKPAAFEWASTNGSVAYFLSCEKLTNNSTAVSTPATSCTTASQSQDLYRWDAGAASGSHLTDLAVDNEPTDGPSAKVLGMIGSSDNGDTVYFAAEGQIVAGKSTAAGAKVYRVVWNGGAPTVEYLATIETGQPGEQNWSTRENSGAGGEPASRLTTPDGAYLLIETAKVLDPGADYDSDADVYRWSQQAGWSCASCQPLGTSSSGASSFDAKLFRNGTVLKRTGHELRIVMSDDGQQVFFGTNDPLAAADTNGRQDVYEWHDGAVSLISDGGDVGGTLLGASRSGRDVFFFTTQQLVGWDTDPYSDIYDARIGGGFPEPPASVPPCEGDDCQGVVQSTPPGSAQLGSVLPSSGNTASGRKPKRCNRISQGAQHKRRQAKRADGKQARSLSRQAGKLDRKFKSCKRAQGKGRQGS